MDRDRCEGNAVCLGRASDVFDLDYEDYARSEDGSSFTPYQKVWVEQAIVECLRTVLLRQDLNLHKLTRANRMASPLEPKLGLPYSRVASRKRPICSERSPR